MNAYCYTHYWVMGVAISQQSYVALYDNKILILNPKKINMCLKSQRCNAVNIFYILTKVSSISLTGRTDAHFWVVFLVVLQQRIKISLSLDLSS